MKPDPAWGPAIQKQATSTEHPTPAVPSESAIHRRAASRGLKVEKLIGGRPEEDRYMLVDAASGVVIRKELHVEELVDVLAGY